MRNYKMKSLKKVFILRDYSLRIKINVCKNIKIKIKHKMF